MIMTQETSLENVFLSVHFYKTHVKISLQEDVANINNGCLLECDHK